MRVVIVGGGASGVMLACHLLKLRTDQTLEILIVERNTSVGCGVAYGTQNSGHLLNVRPENMSVFPDDPGHFWRWLKSENLVTGAPDQLRFLPRHIYGAYLHVLAVDAMQDTPSRLSVHHGECVSLEMAADSAVIVLDDGKTVQADVVVLATGNELPGAPHRNGVLGWRGSSHHIEKTGTILIRGTGLTMIDEVQSIFGSGYRGKIVAMSRHGLMSQVHRETKPVLPPGGSIPSGASCSATMRWLRAFAAEVEAGGGDWRSAVDGIRPFTQNLWLSWPESERRRFLRHARSWWDVHRHRVAPAIDFFVRNMIDSGRLSLRAGKVIEMRDHDGGCRVIYRPRGSAAVSCLDVDAVIDCTGVVTDPEASHNPIVRHVLDNDLARVDPLGIGIAVTPACAVIDAAGRPSNRLFAVGPITRAALWEIVAIPDIRLQCATLARDLLQSTR